MITENLSTLKIHKLTQAQYDRELANGTLDENALYLTPDDSVVSKELILASSTVNSTKQFRITVDDTGILTATEIAE